MSGNNTSGMAFTSTYNGGATQVPFQRTVEPSMLTAFLGLEQKDALRLKRYEEHWRFYLGDHWSFSREGGESLVTINLVKTIIDKGASWLLGKGFTHEIPVALVDPILPHLKRQWELNKRDVLLQKIAQVGGVTGDVFLLVTPKDVTDAERKLRPELKSFVKITVLGSEMVHPLWDPLDTEKLHGVKIITMYTDDTAATLAPDQPQTQVQLKRFEQIITATEFIEVRDGVIVKSEPNLLGEIPLVHIPNMVLTNEYYGLSDVDGGLLDVQRELNEKATDISDIINYSAHPITVIIGAKAKNLETGPNRVWSGFPAGTEVSKLELKSDLKAARDWVAQLQSWLLETSELPENALGKVPPISNTSGVALNTQFQSIVERVNRKRPMYEAGLAEVDYFILRWLQVTENLKLPQGFCRNCGGKVVHAVVLDRKTGKARKDAAGNVLTKPRCYEADPWLGEFTDPDDIKVNFVKQFSFGAEIQEAKRWQVVSLALEKARSFWDPFADVDDNVRSGDLEEKDQARRARRFGKTYTIGKPSDDEFEQFDVTLPDGTLQVPLEPETVLLEEPVLDAAGDPTFDDQGNLRVQTVEHFIVPKDCERPDVYNPLDTKVKITSALPRDEHLEAQLAIQLTSGRLWSREHAMREIGVENPGKMLKQVAADSPDMEKGAKGGSQYGGAGDDIPKTAAQGGEEVRQAERGSANAPATE